MNWLDWLMIFWLFLVSATIIIIILDKKQINKGEGTMTKECDYQDCNEEVADWMELCPKHYAMTQQQKTQSKMQTTEQHTQQPKPEPEMVDVEPVKQPTQTKPVQTSERQNPMLPPEFKTQEIKFEQELPVLSERERLIVKQSSFKGAIELMSKMDFENKDWDDLIGEIEMMTIEFYRMIVTENENRKSE